MGDKYKIRVEKGRPVKVYPNGAIEPMTRKEVYDTEDPYLIDKYEDFYEYAMELMSMCREDY